MFDAAADLLDLSRISKTVQDDIGAEPGQLSCDPEANAAGRSGDDRYFAFQHEKLLSMMVAGEVNRGGECRR
ncbi:hypothetical protein [Bradyrhizobium sp. 162]|uniref:hypothetical protein n=1 Tax=Bradyrhizobium sp. 162 TaxID=2782635 RepID=UPI001FF8B994